MNAKEEILIYLNKSMSKFERVVENLGENQLNVVIQEKDGGWTTIEILRHIQNSELALLQNIESILRGGEGTKPDFDVDRYNTSLINKMANLSLEAVVLNMRMYRKQTLELLDSLSEEQLEMKGRHPTMSTYTVKRQFEIISWHQHHHLKGIREKFGFE